jgi:hypothetical protein
LSTISVDKSVDETCLGELSCGKHCKSCDLDNICP